MKKRYGIAAAVSAAVLLAAGLFWIGGGPKEEKVTLPVFEPQLENRVQFHQAGKSEDKERFRVVQYAPNGNTKVGARVEYTSGKTGFLVFRTASDGAISVRSAKIVYPAAAGVVDRQVARELELDSDGKTFIKDRVFSESGVLVFKGDRIDTEKYETFDYREDGKNLKRHQMFGRDYGVWKVNLEEIFRPDNSVEKTVNRAPNGVVVTKKFAEGDKLEWSSELTNYGGNLDTNYFEADGKTINKTTNQTSYDVTVSHYAGGKRVDTIRFYGNNNYIGVSQYDDAGKLTRRQSFVTKVYNDLRTDGKIDITKYRLKEIEYFDPTGAISKDIDLYEDGVTPRSFVTKQPRTSGWYQPQTTRRYRKDGTLSEVSVYDGSASITNTETHTVDENIKEPIDAVDLAPYAFEASPPDTVKASWRVWNNR